MKETIFEAFTLIVGIAILFTIIILFGIPKKDYVGKTYEFQNDTVLVTGFNGHGDMYLSNGVTIDYELAKEMLKEVK